MAAAAPDAQQLWDTPNVAMDAMVGDGSATEAAFAGAAHIARLETHVQRVTGVPMEPRTALAAFDPDTNRYTLYAGGGGVGRPKRDVAHMLGVEDAQVRVVAHDVGGNFGTRANRFASAGGDGRRYRLCRRQVHHQGTDRAVDLFTVTAAAEGDASVPEMLRGPLVGTGDVVSRIASFPHGWHVAEVEVDPETGLVELARYTAIDDVGRAVNPMIIHGQTHGGIAQGMGQALIEHCIYDPKSGQALAGSFMDYAMPSADDLPFFATDISEVPSTTHPLGFRGGGEGGITPSLGVIVNAIVDALAEFGVTHVEMPATAEKVWRAMRTGRTASAGGAEAR
jgi:CO/xanthine dehydrogenase Mo-binding subunit